MTETPILIETSFADAIAIIAAAPELSEHIRMHWPSSMRQVAKFMDRSPKDIPARYSAIRADLSQLHHAPAGLTAKTLQNHKSNTKSALLWLAREKGVPEYGAPLTAAWEKLRAEVRGSVARSRLSSFMRYATPTAADVEYRQAGPVQAELGGDETLLGLLRFFKRFGSLGEISSGVHAVLR